MPNVKMVVSADVNPASIAAGAIANTPVALPDATLGDLVIPVGPSDLEAGLVPVGCSVSADGTVQLRLFNPTAGAVDGAARRWQFVIIREP